MVGELRVRWCFLGNELVTLVTVIAYCRPRNQRFRQGVPGSDHPDQVMGQQRSAVEKSGFPGRAPALVGNPFTGQVENGIKTRVGFQQVETVYGLDRSTHRGDSFRVLPTQYRQ